MPADFTEAQIEAAERAFTEAWDNPMLAALRAADALAWQNIATAPRDGTPIWARFRSDLHKLRDELGRWNGKYIPLRHEGRTPSGFDLGWSVAAPLGYGGVPDEWIEAWRHLPTPPGGTDGR